MFGGYTEVAAYYVNTPWPELGDDEQEESGEDQLPPGYATERHLPDPWHTTAAYQTDFILIAEFSEQEGPKPLIVIPKDGSGPFDLNDFAVRIMSVDFQTVASSLFSLAEDTQVIMSEKQNGIYAHVHHFTLYDHQARGFVRPFCMSYVTTNHNKLLQSFEDMSEQFRKVAHLFKYGNLGLFVKDMTHYLSDLHYTKGRFLERESSPDTDFGLTDPFTFAASDPEEDLLLQSVTVSGLENLISEVKAILSSTSNLLSDINDKALDEHFQDLEERSHDNRHYFSEETLDLENFQYSCSLQSQHLQGIQDWNESRQRAGSDSTSCSQVNWTEDKDIYKPKLVRTTNKKRFDKSLRGLHELCMWGAKEGLNRLRSLHKYFSRELYALVMERMDASCLYPSAGLLTIGHTVQLNFLSGLGRCNWSQDDESPESIGTLSRKWYSSDTVASFQSAESFFSCEEDVVSTSRTQSNSHYPIVVGNTCMPETPLVCPKAKESDKNEVFAYNRFLASTIEAEKLSYDSTVSISDSFDSAPDQESVYMISNTGDSSSLEASAPEVMPAISSADHITGFNYTSIGYGLQKLGLQFPALGHILYSLMCGRPTFVFGTFRMEKEIRATVNSLALFVPGYSSYHQSVILWHSQPLCLQDLMHFKLVGLARPERRKLDFMVPSSVKPYVTILDLEKKMMWTPEYHGGILTNIHNKRKNFTSEQTYIAYIHNVFFDLAVKSYLYFYKFCQKSEFAVSPPKTMFHDQIADKLAFSKSQSNILESLKVNGQDTRIVQYLAEVIAQQCLESSSSKPTQDISDNTAKRIWLDYSICSWLHG